MNVVYPAMLLDAVHSQPLDLLLVRRQRGKAELAPQLGAALEQRNTVAARGSNARRLKARGPATDDDDILDHKRRLDSSKFALTLGRGPGWRRRVLQGHKALLWLAPELGFADGV